MLAFLIAYIMELITEGGMLRCFSFFSHLVNDDGEVGRCLDAVWGNKSPTVLEIG